jgi:CubicO group peptidase (beta-lactamase class C family)
MHRSALLLAFGSTIACTEADARRRTDNSDQVGHVRVGAIDTARLDRAFALASELPRMRSLLVQWKGQLVRETYFGGTTPSMRANIKSASKSIISALVGIAIARGHIKSVRQTVGDLLPTDARGLDSIKRAITVEHLLSMRAGLQSTSFDNYGSWVTSRNWVRHALRQPMVDEPGGAMVYSTGSTHLLSAILTRATRMSTYEFAQRHLARPLGVTLRPWQTDPQGIYFGGNDMYLTPREMLKIGALYLNGGVANGRQIVPRAWIDSSFVPRTISPFNGNRYGYGWWTRNAHGHDIRFAWGYGGQFIFVVPDLELVIVATSDPNARRYWGHTDALHGIVEDWIIPAVAN